MSKQKVIPALGQIWFSGFDEHRIKNFRGGFVNFEVGGMIGIDDIHRFFTFKPSNDLEWLAVNVDQWVGDYTRLQRVNDQGEFSYIPSRGYESFTFQQWQGKRNELFGDKVMTPAKKMNVEYEKCEFDKLSELVLHYENEGTLYGENGGAGSDYVKSDVYTSICRFKHGDPIYRRIETEWTWYDAVDEFVNECIYLSLDDIERIVEGNCGIKHTEAFIAMCHLVESMTDKPE